MNKENQSLKEYRYTNIPVYLAYPSRVKKIKSIYQTNEKYTELKNFEEDYFSHEI